MNHHFIIVAKSLLHISRIIEAEGYGVLDYGKLPPTDPKRLTSPHDQKKNFMELLNSPPFTGEWVNKNIGSGLFKMENSQFFVKQFPQVRGFSKALSVKLMDMFRQRLANLTDADVNNDYSEVIMFVTKARMILTTIRETLSKMPSSMEGINSWIEKLQQLTEAFSTVLTEGIEEVKHLKTSAIKNK